MDEIIQLVERNSQQMNKGDIRNFKSALNFSSEKPLKPSPSSQAKKDKAVKAILSGSPG